MPKMSRTKSNYYLRILSLFFLVATTAVAISYLGMNITRDMKLLNSADSDNVQWSLTQAEVEFLDFDIELSVAANQTTPDLSLLRRKYDIFYSRIKTLSQSQIYDELRRGTTFALNLKKAQVFLDEILPIIDAQDSTLVASLPNLMDEANAVRPFVRSLANSGLMHFAAESDRRRETLANTLGQMAIAAATLAIALIVLAIYLGVLARRNAKGIVQLNRASERMKIITSTSLDAVIVSDSSGRILDYNTAAESTFGYPRDYAIGKPLGELIVPEKLRDAHNQGMQRMRDHGEKVIGKGRVQLEALRQDGTIFPVEVAIQSAKTRDGEVFIAFLRDISDKVAADEELIKARDRALEGERAKARFLATMSHEIRTPLNGLLGNLTLIRSTKLSAKQTKYIENMEASGGLLMNHISDVLDVLSYESGKLQIRLAPVDLSALLEEIVNSLSGAAVQNGTMLEWGWVGDPVSWVKTDYRKLQHILVNLIGNAIKFTQNGRVSVGVEFVKTDSGAEEVVITVRDSGVGIPPEQIDTIFEDFVTGNASYNREAGGTGLGLGIAKRFVTALEGRIEVESAPEIGSKFTVTVPVTAVEEPTSDLSAELKTPSAKPLDILLVEDNEINSFVATEMLVKMGHSVTVAANGKAGVDFADAHKYDLILMDISMPVMDGREATRVIRAGNGASNDTPIVALTANVLANEQEMFLADGMNDVITKPLTEGALSHVSNTWGMQKNADSHLLSEQHLSEMREMIGQEQYELFIDRLNKEVTRMMAENLNVASLEFDEVVEVAHKVAGTAATLGAKDFASQLNALENAARAKDLAEVERLVGILPELWEKTLGAFKERA
ncbi:ATP-binding protein [Rhodobacteraceae bacterium D3-12]|nr:ATP-binding protein [Rhodobacteraceae bacterium D3-12]